MNCIRELSCGWEESWPDQKQTIFGPKGNNEVKEKMGKKKPRVMRVFMFVEGLVELGEVEDLCLCVLEGGFVGCWVLVGIGSC